MVDCEAAESLCETVFEFGGGFGECDNVTGLCLCEEGFSGQDSFEVFNDCRVNEDTKEVMHALVVAVSGFALFMSFVHLAILRLRWHLGSLPSLGCCALRCARLVGVNPATDEDATNAMTSSRAISTHDSDSYTEAGGGATTEGSEFKKQASFSSPHQVQVEHKSKKKRRRRKFWTMSSVALLLLHNAATLVFTMGFFFGDYRSDLVFYQDVAYTIALASVFSALWAFAYLQWLQLSMPGFRKFQTLFAVRSVFIRRPRLFRLCCVFRISLIWLLVPLLVFLPYLIEGSRQTADSVLLGFCFVVVLDFNIFCLLLCNILITLFGSLEGTRGPRRNSNGGSTTSLPTTALAPAEQRAFRRAIFTIRTIQAAIILIGVPAMLGFLLAAVLQDVATRKYLTVNAIFIASNLASLCVVYVLVWRLTKMRNNNRKPSRAFAAFRRSTASASTK